MELRLIPALAGKTCPDRPQRVSEWAHPRAGGENWGEVSGDVNVSGSSPRWRGKHAKPPAPRGQARLIPALAGKTTLYCDWSERLAAHPRAGGENDTEAGKKAVEDGSSPRWRGKLVSDNAPVPTVGLIPALAGKT